MTAEGQSGTGDAGSTYDTTNGKLDFPGVPYTAENFTPRDLCPSASGKFWQQIYFPLNKEIKEGDFFIQGNVDNYDDLNNAYNCRLYGLADLYGRSTYVRQTIANYFNKLIDIGVAGFLIDTAKNVWPEVRVI